MPGGNGNRPREGGLEPLRADTVEQLLLLAWRKWLLWALSLISGIHILLAGTWVWQKIDSLKRKCRGTACVGAKKGGDLDRQKEKGMQENSRIVLKTNCCQVYSKLRRWWKTSYNTLKWTKKKCTNKENENRRDRVTRAGISTTWHNSGRATGSEALWADCHSSNCLWFC